jgi:hypothetical protein
MTSTIAAIPLAVGESGGRRSNAYPRFTSNEYSIYAKQTDKANYTSPEAEFDAWSNVTTKPCSKCDKVKRLIEFGGNTSGADAFDSFGNRLRRPECIECTRQAAHGKSVAMKTAKKLGIAFKAPEGTLCAICDLPARRGDGLVFDHDHETCTFRGYLHNSCNRSCGVLGDDVESLLRAVNYLNKGIDKKIVQDPETGELRIVE